MINPVVLLVNTRRRQSPQPVRVVSQMPIARDREAFDPHAVDHGGPRRLDVLPDDIVIGAGRQYENLMAPAGQPLRVATSTCAYYRGRGLS